MIETQAPLTLRILDLLPPLASKGVSMDFLELRKKLGLTRDDNDFLKEELENMLNQNMIIRYNRHKTPSFQRKSDVEIIEHVLPRESPSTLLSDRTGMNEDEIREKLPFLSEENIREGIAELKNKGAISSGSQPGKAMRYWKN